jgi:hypothetical protein
MKERVCALVSRVQGTFEFEVQPLREYFCAKYLYKSVLILQLDCGKEGQNPIFCNSKKFLLAKCGSLLQLMVN